MSVWNFAEIGFDVFEKQSVEKIKGVSVHTNGSIIISDDTYDNHFNKYPLCVVYYDKALGLIGLQPIPEDHADADKAYVIMTSENGKDKRPTLSLKTMFKEFGWSEKIKESIRFDDIQHIEWRERQLIVLNVGEHFKVKEEAAAPMTTEAS